MSYGGPTAASSKSLTLTDAGEIQINTPSANLTMNGVISQSAPGAQFFFYGSGSAANPATLTLTANNSYSGATFVGTNGILAIPTIGNAGGGGTNSPLGASSNAPGNLQIGNLFNRGDLLLTGVSPTYSTDRGVTLTGLYESNGGGGIGVQNGGTNLTWNGQITGAGSLIKTGAGVLTLNNETNNYSGGTYVEGGRLALRGCQCHSGQRECHRVFRGDIRRQ